MWVRNVARREVEESGIIFLVKGDRETIFAAAGPNASGTVENGVHFKLICGTTSSKILKVTRQHLEINTVRTANVMRAVLGTGFRIIHG